MRCDNSETMLLLFYIVTYILESVGVYIVSFQLVYVRIIITEFFLYYFGVGCIQLQVVQQTIILAISVVQHSIGRDLATLVLS